MAGDVYPQIFLSQSSQLMFNYQDPKGTLNSKIRMPSSAIALANLVINSVIAISNSGGPYLHLTLAQKFQIGKTATEYGVTSA